MSANDIMQIIAVATLALICLSVTTHLSRAFLRWVEQRHQQRPPLDESRMVAALEELRDRMAHLEHAVEASAVELERIGEADRFMAKLLAERVPAVPAPRVERSERVITPH